jgi:hypothetical protein
VLGSVVWYVRLLPPISARGFAEGGGVMQRLAVQVTQTDWQLLFGARRWDGVAQTWGKQHQYRGELRWLTTARRRRCLNRTKLLGSMRCTCNAGAGRNVTTVRKWLDGAQVRAVRRLIG